MNIVMIGLGHMGGNMALTLQTAGFTVIGTDVAEVARRNMAARGLAVVGPEALPAADVYLLSLPSSAQVREVIESSPGLLRQAPKGSVIVDTSTSDPVVSRELAKMVVEAGLEWLDAPVSGGPAGAATGALGMLLGGEASTIERVEPMLKAMSARYTHVGEAGSGHVVKLANNYLCAAHLLTTAEAVALAMRAGVAPEACLAGLNSGSGRSAVSEVNFPKWVLPAAFDSGFTTGLMRKDLRLARDAAAGMGLSLDLLSRVVEQWHANADALPDSADFNHVTDEILRLAQADGATSTQEAGQ
ncbi:NAD(P)-dependent oxidoreductase [Halomonas sp. IOP_31]|uniref:NAD(P)-dependent oxidoreductase n=1 Tax=Halomonas sp. IOP_31 TaxID=2876584 RepID=UPI001E2B23A5|nr:NAD(P)-dependent oxidoreductase [Halomonas sp. IOP_31]MCD6008969.1 NAD(P)-dependent oxidoreductase [Halomonas sp. IOP_31]